MELNELYSEMILEYSKEKRYRTPLMRPRVQVEGVNPSCGDEIQLQLDVENGVIKDLSVLGSGCAISMASANMMAGLVEGQSVDTARHKLNIFLDMIQKGEQEPDKLDELEDAQVLQNISHMPARVKCAVLAWHTLKQAIEQLSE